MSWTPPARRTLRDPRVGRDILVGIVAGVGRRDRPAVRSCCCRRCSDIAPPPPRNINLRRSCSSTRQALSALLTHAARTPCSERHAHHAAVRRSCGCVVKRTWLAAVDRGRRRHAFVVVSRGRHRTAGAQRRCSRSSCPPSTWSCSCASACSPLMMAFLINFIAEPGRPDRRLLEALRADEHLADGARRGLAAFGFYASRAGEPLFGKLAET